MVNKCPDSSQIMSEFLDPKIPTLRNSAKDSYIIILQNSQAKSEPQTLSDKISCEIFYWANIFSLVRLTYSAAKPFSTKFCMNLILYAANKTIHFLWSIRFQTKQTLLDHQIFLIVKLIKQFTILFYKYIRWCWFLNSHKYIAWNIISYQYKQFLTHIQSCWPSEISKTTV